MLVILTLVACLLGTIVAVPNSDECPRIMSEAGLNPNFARVITHSIHSLTLEDIRYYFKPDAPEDNGIPTVNQDLESDERVLLNVPLVGYDEDFTTVGLKTFDMVMRNMDRMRIWGITHYNVLETVAHRLHMSETWSNAVGQYKLIAKLLDPESDVCACVTDIENNGVLNHVHVTALKIRYPGITSGNDTITERYLAHSTNHSEFQGSDSHVKVKRSVDKVDIYYAVPVRRLFYRSGYVNFDGIDFDLSDAELLEDVAEKLVDGDVTTMHSLDSAESWITDWKTMLTLPKEESYYYDFAMFMFCMLN